MAVVGLLNDGPARQTLAEADVAVPHLVDSEIAHTFRRLVRQHLVPARAAEAGLRRWSRLGVHRFAAAGLLDRMWALRDNLTARSRLQLAALAATGSHGSRKLALLTDPWVVERAYPRVHPA